MNDWASDAIFYHLYPLGCLGAPARNDFASAPVNRLAAIEKWIPYLQDLGINAILLGPVFESSAHGYDTADLFKVDRRLGDEDALAKLSAEFHSHGIRVVFDAVFNHTGRDFWAFRDVLEKGEASPYRDWYHLDFSRRSPSGDAFHYKGWAGNYDLAKLNLSNPEVRDHVFSAVSSWIERFQIDGLRIDAADAIDLDFQRELVRHGKSLRPDFWLMGEVVRGDYRKWAYPGGLSSITNYEAYKGLWSSHNDGNYFEIAHTLKREFGPEGMYRGLPLYAFADNHDVERVASILKEPAHMYPLYILLFTMPGVPSIYYGSEWGIEGRKIPGTDAPLRPALDPEQLKRDAPHPKLHRTIKRLIEIRHQHQALRQSDYAQLHVAHEQFAFLRSDATESTMVAVNAADRRIEIPIHVADRKEARLVDVLNDGETFSLRGGRCALPIDARWGRILAIR